MRSEASEAKKMSNHQPIQYTISEAHRHRGRLGITDIQIIEWETTFRNRLLFDSLQTCNLDTKRQAAEQLVAARDPELWEDRVTCTITRSLIREEGIISEMPKLIDFSYEEEESTRMEDASPEMSKNVESSCEEEQSTRMVNASPKTSEDIKTCLEEAGYTRKEDANPEMSRSLKFWFDEADSTRTDDVDPDLMRILEFLQEEEHLTPTGARKPCTAEAENVVEKVFETKEDANIEPFEPTDTKAIATAHGAADSTTDSPKRKVKPNEKKDQHLLGEPTPEELNEVAQMAEILSLARGQHFLSITAFFRHALKSGVSHLQRCTFSYKATTEAIATAFDCLIPSNATCARQKKEVETSEDPSWGSPTGRYTILLGLVTAIFLFVCCFWYDTEPTW